MVKTSYSDRYILPAVSRSRLAEINKTANAVPSCKNIRQAVIAVRQDNILRRAVVFQPFKKLPGILKAAFSKGLRLCVFNIHKTIGNIVFGCL